MRKTFAYFSGQPGSHLSALLKHKIDKGGRERERERERKLGNQSIGGTTSDDLKLQLIGAQSDRERKVEKGRTR